MNNTTRVEWLRNNPPLLTAKEVAQLLGLSQQHIYRMATEKRLPSFKMGRNRRFKASEMLLWVENKAGEQL